MPTKRPAGLTFHTAGVQYGSLLLLDSGDRYGGAELYGSRSHSQKKNASNLTCKLQFFPFLGTKNMKQITHLIKNILWFKLLNIVTKDISPWNTSKILFLGRQSVSSETFPLPNSVSVCGHPFFTKGTPVGVFITCYALHYRLRRRTLRLCESARAETAQWGPSDSGAESLVSLFRNLTGLQTIWRPDVNWESKECKNDTRPSKS
jgi:hypothetical protein